MTEKEKLRLAQIAIDGLLAQIAIAQAAEEEGLVTDVTLIRSETPLTLTEFLDGMAREKLLTKRSNDNEL